MKLWKLAKARWTVYAVCDDAGSCPVLDFLASLDEAMRRKLWAEIRLTAQRGPEKHNTQKSRKIKGYSELYELKRGARRGPKARILYFYRRGMVVICTNGFTKAERTPRDELERAEAIRVEYERDEDAGAITVVHEEPDP